MERPPVYTTSGRNGKMTGGACRNPFDITCIENYRQVLCFPCPRHILLMFFHR